MLVITRPLQVLEAAKVPKNQLYVPSGLPLATEAGLCALKLSCCVFNFLLVGLSDGKNVKMVRDSGTGRKVLTVTRPPVAPLDDGFKAYQKNLTPGQKNIMRQVSSPDCMELLAVTLASAIAHNRQQQEHVWDTTRGPPSTSSGDGEYFRQVGAELLNLSVPMFHSSWPLFVIPDEEWTASEIRQGLGATHRVLRTLQLLLDAAAVLKTNPMISVGKSREVQEARGRPSW